MILQQYLYLYLVLHPSCVHQFRHLPQAGWFTSWSAKAGVVLGQVVSDLWLQENLRVPPQCTPRKEIRS